MPSQRINNPTSSKKASAASDLPVPIHPDDAKDKVLTAILKALLKMENKPSSPKELATIINKYKYATLGGATPFATVSSRISQHFKRAATHNPPRPPLLEKHVDQNHSRKISYSLALDSSPAHSADNDSLEPTNKDNSNNSNNNNKRKQQQNDTSSVSSLSSLSDSENEGHSVPPSNSKKKRKLKPAPDVFISPNSPPQSQDKPIKQQHSYTDDEDDTNSEHSDYHEEMLKQVDDHDNATISHTPHHLQLAARRYSIQSNAPAERKASFCSGYPTGGEQELWTSFSFNNEHHQEEQHHSGGDPTAHLIPFHIDTPESVSVSELDSYFASDSSNRKRKSLSKSMMGPNDESLLEKVLMDSAAKGVADKLQQIDLAQVASALNQENTSTHNTMELRHGKEDATMEVIHEEDEEQEEETANPEQVQQHKEKTSAASGNDLKMFDSDAMNGEDFVHFEEEEEEEEEVEEEEKEKQEEQVKDEENNPSTTATTTSSSTTTTTTQLSTASAQQNAAAAAAPIRKVADILPATITNQQQQNIINATEILKSMNIQTLNLSALHHMTSSIPSLQHLSPAFDLAKTMAAYMQSLAKSANANSGTPLATDLKNILSRFPALEAFIKKDQTSSSTPIPSSSSSSSIASTSSSASSTPLTVNINLNSSSSSSSSSKHNIPTTPTTPTKPVVSNKPYVPPSHIQGKDQVVYTINSMCPAMYITVIDSIAICVVVFSTKTTPPQEYRIMRRLDNQFVNGTVLLTAGGIETERERSMILSFEMDRVRMPKPENVLFGTWIPLRRAQELACTCSIQNTLAQFLDNDVLQYFPTPLPIKIVNKKKPTIQDNRNHRLAALALAALRNQSSSKQSKQTSMELLIDNPNKLLKTNNDTEIKRGGKWSSTPLIKKSASWNGASGVKRQPSTIKRKSKQSTKHVSDEEEEEEEEEELIIDIEDDDDEEGEEEEENVVVEHTTQLEDTKEPVTKQEPTEEPIEEKKVIVHAEEENEDEDDEDIDIGGSDCDDDLR